MGSLSSIDATAWNLAAARHLLNRAGFGVPRGLAESLAGMTPEGAVDYLLNYEDIPFAYPEPDFLEPAFTNRERKALRKVLNEEERREQRQEWQRAERLAVRELRAWWVQRMRLSPRPLEEKMALFWHGHFATSAQKVKPSAHNYALIDVFHKHGTGNFKTLVTEVGQSPAMLRYLDNDRSTKRKPNENWARELMELFTLGQGQYTEEDIKNAARAFTGWSTDGRDFRINVKNHDTGSKTFLGRTGAFDGGDIIDILFEQEALSQFICGKLWRFFGSEEMDGAVVSAMAKTFRENNYALKPVLRELFLSRAFYADEVRATQVKSPVQLVVNLSYDLHLDSVPPTALAHVAASLGQDILHPPNVKGWDGNTAWINANTLLLRYNVPVHLYQAAQKGHRQAMAGEGDAMMMSGGESTMAADAAAMKPGKKPGDGNKPLRDQVRAKLKGLPKDERQAKMKVLRAGNPAQRRALLKELGITPPRAHNPLEAIFEGMEFTTASECVVLVAQSMLDVPLADKQRQVLLGVLGVSDPAASLTPEALTPARQQQLLHMITSMAEYQLC